MPRKKIITNTLRAIRISCRATNRSILTFFFWFVHTFILSFVHTFVRLFSPTFAATQEKCHKESFLRKICVHFMEELNFYRHVFQTIRVRVYVEKCECKKWNGSFVPFINITRLTPQSRTKMNYDYYILAHSACHFSSSPNILPNMKYRPSFQPFTNSNSKLHKLSTLFQQITLN